MSRTTAFRVIPKRWIVLAAAVAVLLVHPNLVSANDIEIGTRQIRAVQTLLRPLRFGRPVLRRLLGLPAAHKAQDPKSNSLVIEPVLPVVTVAIPVLGSNPKGVLPHSPMSALKIAGSDLAAQPGNPAEVLDRLFTTGNKDVAASERPEAVTYEEALGQLSGKRVLIISSGYKGKAPFYEALKKRGVELILVEQSLTGWRKSLDNWRVRFGFKSREHWARDSGLFTHVLALSKPISQKDIPGIIKRLKQFQSTHGKFDAITTYWEDALIPTAKIARALKLKYHPVKAAKIMRDKASARETLREARLPNPRFARIPIERVPFWRFWRRRQIEQQAVNVFLRELRRIGLPVIVKPVAAAAANGVNKFSTNGAESVDKFKRVMRWILNDPDTVYDGNVHLLIEQFLRGKEFDVDIAFQNGEVVFVSVTDNWKTGIGGNFAATGSDMPPAKLTPAQQQEVISLIVAGFKAIGVCDGVVHGEGMYTADGALFLEPNGRVAGEYIPDWIRKVWGVYLPELEIILRLGIPIKPLLNLVPQTHLSGAFIFAHRAGVLRDLKLNEEDSGKLAAMGLHALTIKIPPGSNVAPLHGGDHRLGMLAAQGKSAAKARANLEQLKERLIVNIDPAQISLWQFLINKIFFWN